VYVATAPPVWATSAHAACTIPSTATQAARDRLWWPWNESNATQKKTPQISQILFFVWVLWFSVSLDRQRDVVLVALFNRHLPGLGAMPSRNPFSPGGDDVRI
jgi:hypothetical protein